MQSVDGDIRLSVDFEKGSVEQSVRNLAKTTGKVFSSSASNIDKASVQVQKLENRLLKARDKMIELAKKQQEIGEQKIPTQEYKEIQEQVAQANKQFESLLKRQENMELHGKNSGKVWNNLSAKIDEVGNEIRYAEQEMAQLEASGKAFTSGTLTDEYKKATQEVIYQRNEVNVINTQLQEQLAKEQQVAAQEDEIVKKTSIWREILSTVGQSIMGAFRGFGWVMQGIGKGIATIPAKVGNAVSGIAKHISKIPAKLKSLKAHSDKTFGGMIKKVLAYGLGIRSLFVLFRKLRGYATEAFKSMAKQFPSVDAQLSELVNTFNQFKNSIGTALQPLLNVLVPALTTIINYATQAAEAVGNFFAALTGQQFIYKATKSNKSYAASLESAGSAAKEANEQLADYDKLLVINSKQDGGSGGGGSGAGAGVFEQVPVESGIKNLVEKIKDIWNTDADFTDLGKAVGDKLVKGMNSIDWTSIQTTAGKLGKSISTFLSGSLDTEIGKSVGNTIAGGINTAIEFAYGLVVNFDFKKFGSQIGTGLSTAIKNIDWQKLGQTVSETVSGAFDIVSGFFQNLDAKEVVEAIGKFINGIDWEQVASSLLEAVLSMITFFFEIGGEIGDNILNWFDEIGQNGIGGLIEGITTGFTNFVSWITGIFNDYLIQPIKDFLGIHSPSTMFSEIGENIVKGLSEGISGLIDGILTFFEDLWNDIKNVFNGVETWFSETFGGALDAIQEALQPILDWIQDKLDWIDEQLINLGIKKKPKKNPAFTELCEQLVETQEELSNVGEESEKVDTQIRSIGEGAKDTNNSMGNLNSTTRRTTGSQKELNTTIRGTSTSTRGYNTSINESNRTTDNFRRTIDGATNATGELRGQGVENARGLRDGLNTNFTEASNNTTTQFTGIKNTIQSMMTGAKSLSDTNVIGIKNTIGTQLQEASSGTSTNMQNIKNTIANNLINAKNDASTNMATLKDNLIARSNEAQTGVQSKFSELKNKVLDSLGSGTRTTANNSMTNIKNDLIARSNETQNDIGTKFGNIKNSIINNLSNTNAGNLAKNIKEQVSNNISGVTGNVDNQFGGNGLLGIIQNRMAQALGQVQGQVGSWGSAGNNLVAGLRDGISNQWSAGGTAGIIGKVLSLASNLTQKLKNAFGIHSPSRVWREEIGKFLPYGLAEGITDGSGKVTSAIHGLVDDMNDVMQNADLFNPLSALDTSINIPNMNIPALRTEVPALARGAVIPPNREFLARLGDQKSGVNIESPLDTMVQAFTMALDSRSETNKQPIIIQLPNGRVLAELVWDEEAKRYKQTGLRTRRV